MNAVRGKYYDGVRSKGLAASLCWSAVGAAVVTDAGLRIDIDRAKLEVPSPLPGTPTRIALGEKESFVTGDNAAIEELRHALALTPGLAGRIERRMPAVAAAAALAIALLAGLGVWGVPALASRLALHVSEDVSARMSAALLAQLDTFLQPSRIEPERQRELTRYFNSHGEIRILEFRDAGIFGANAITLGATMIAFSDALVELADTDEELLAVYFHELGHARLRHVEQNLFRGSAWLVLLTVLTGDVGAVGELLVSLPLAAGLAAYSREFEREADAFAVDRLIEAGVSPTALASILQKLEDHHARRGEAARSAETGNPGQQTDTAAGERSTLLSLLDYLASHPPADERVDYIHSRMREILRQPAP